MNLLAISDLHLSFEENRRALSSLRGDSEGWLILAGDLGESLRHFEFAFEVLSPRFRRLVWVPGNHDLWTAASGDRVLKGQAKYERLVELCRAYGVLTPEDPYPVIRIGGRDVRIVPLFLLYDYSFCPDDVPVGEAVGWALQDGICCSDEKLLSPDPYSDIPAWCRARCEATEHRLSECRDGVPAVLINHFPLRRDLVWLPRIPRFRIWCGTRRTEDWHRRFNAAVVISGHLHTPSTSYRDGVRFEEVSLGYPRQWSGHCTINERVRRIITGDAGLPPEAPTSPQSAEVAPAARR